MDFSHLHCLSRRFGTFQWCQQNQVILGLLKACLYSQKILRQPRGTFYNLFWDTQINFSSGSCSKDPTLQKVEQQLLDCFDLLSHPRKSLFQDPSACSMACFWEKQLWNRPVQRQVYSKTFSAFQETSSNVSHTPAAAKMAHDTAGEW